MKLPDTFRGYHPPESNTTYTPNQFFDVVLPFSSRGVVRLVAYIIRKTLGWCDANGNPQEPHVVVSYRELIENAGIGRARIKEAIDEAIKDRYIVCLREARPNNIGSIGISALYELRWDDKEEYVTDQDKFDGFYAGNGNLTYIPNEFFDYTIPNEPLAVIRVVGAIIRNTIGFQTRYGMRRQQIAMSYTELQRRTDLTHRSVSIALQQALENNHIVKVEEGFFDTNAGLLSKATIYGIRWIDRQVIDISSPVKVIGQPETDSSKDQVNLTVPKVYRETNGSKSIPEENSERFQKYTGNSSISIPGERFQKYTDIEIKHENKTIEIQQHSRSISLTDEIAAVESIDKNLEELKSLLILTGFDTKTARHLANNYSAEQIKRQIEWLPKRRSTHNKMGMLRKAIEEDWTEPQGDKSVEKTDSNENTVEVVFVSHFYAAWAGNEDEPMSIPSYNDIQTAKTYIERLFQILPDRNESVDCARLFGKFVKDAEADNTKSIRSFVVAVRAHGDEFYLFLMNKRKTIQKEVINSAKKQHEQTFFELYLSYILQRENEIENNYPEDYRAFLQEDSANRLRLIEGPFALRGDVKDRLVASFDSDSKRQERFVEFCNKRHITIYDFWQWDSEMNKDSFDLGKFNT